MAKHASDEAAEEEEHEEPEEPQQSEDEAISQSSAEEEKQQKQQQNKQPQTGRGHGIAPTTTGRGAGYLDPNDPRNRHPSELGFRRGPGRIWTVPNPSRGAQDKK